jgi:pimeloyl-ACP methyl ester carboxylesterase
VSARIFKTIVSSWVSSPKRSGRFPDHEPAAISSFEARTLGLKQVDLLGFSLGGFVAQQVVLESPDLIRRVVLAGTGPQGGEGMDAFTPKVAEQATQETPVIENFLYLFFAPSETSQAAGRAFWERRHTRADQDMPSSVAAMRAQAGAIAQWGVVPKTDRYGQLKRIKQPVLIVNGCDDIMVPSINSFILQQHIPNATLILYPDSGHGALFQYSELFVSHVRLFLDNKCADRGGSPTIQR